MINHLKIQQYIEDEHEAQQLNDFYNQDNEEKKKVLEKVRDDYRKQRIILKQKELINETR